MNARLGPVALWLVGLGAALAALHGLGGALAPPPLTEPGQLGPWLDDRQPAESLMALARVVAIAIAWYLMATTVLAIIARLAGLARMVAVADIVSVPLVRRLVGGGLGLTVVAGSMVGPALASAAPAPPAPTEEAGGAVVMRLLPDEPTASGPPEDTAPAGGPTWEVQPGQHFWAVAEQVLADAWARRPEDREIVEYWRTLIEANRSLLADPANADLLFAGQVLILPAVPPSP